MRAAWEKLGPLARSVVLAVPVGVGAGFLALAFIVVVDEGTAALWPDVEPDAFSGDAVWILVLAAGGFVVGWLRKLLAVPEHVTGAIEAIAQADVDHRLVPKTVAISVVSLVAGTSLGPTFGLVMLGGGLAALAADRLGATAEERSAWILSGESAGLGGALTSPILAGVLGVEIGPKRPAAFDRRALPALLAAALSFAVVVPILGRVFLDVYSLPPYDFAFVHLLVGAAFGVVAAVLAIITGIVVRLTARLGSVVSQWPVLRATGGGVVLGLIGIALPFTMFAGSSQLAVLIQDGPELDEWLVAATIGGKILALAVSMAAGFIGGNMFPMVFVGGAAGVLAHTLIPDIPYALAVSCLMAAVPGSVVRAPVGITLFAAISVGLVPQNAVPVVVAVIVSHFLVSTVQQARQRRTAEPGAAPATAPE